MCLRGILGLDKIQTCLCFIITPFVRPGFLKADDKQWTTRCFSAQQCCKGRLSELTSLRNSLCGCFLFFTPLFRDFISPVHPSRSVYDADVRCLMSDVDINCILLHLPDYMHCSTATKHKTPIHTAEHLSMLVPACLCLLCSTGSSI